MLKGCRTRVEEQVGNLNHATEPVYRGHMVPVHSLYCHPDSERNVVSGKAINCFLELEV